MENKIEAPTKFTKEIKQNLINALKSGKFTQGFDMLYNVMDDSHCCIGVLGCVTPGLDNEVSATDKKSPYCFLTEQIGKYPQNELWKENDHVDYRKKGHRDYRNVLPLIEKLETQD